jgi:hypothetical protein
LIKGRGKIASWRDQIFHTMAMCQQCRNCLRHAAIFRLVDHLKADHNLREEAHAIATEAFHRISEGRKYQKPVLAGNWGERSYDNDSVHDVLDGYRPKGNEGEGFDERIPGENVEALLTEMGKLLDGAKTADDLERYFGVMVFLNTHGTKLQPNEKQLAIGTGYDLLRNADYLGRWKNPAKRKLQIRKELKMLGEQMNRFSSMASDGGKPSDPVCTCGHTFYDHPDGCEHCESCPGFDPKPIEDQVDYVCVRRSFDRKGDKKNPATYERHDGEMILKVYFKNDGVEKAEFISLGRDGQWHEDFKTGWDGFISYTNSWGD